MLDDNQNGIHKYKAIVAVTAVAGVAKSEKKVRGGGLLCIFTLILIPNLLKFITPT